MPLIKEQNTLYYYSYRQLLAKAGRNYIHLTHNGLKRTLKIIKKGKDFLGLKDEIGQTYKITQRKEPRTGRKYVTRNI